MTLSGETLELVLATLRAPTRAFRLRERALPGDVLGVIRLAAGEEDTLAEAGEASGLDAASLRESAAFFLQQALFHPDADAYRVLGAWPAIDDALLKQHYRWLMHWLHPDRAVNQDWSVFADRVSRAWNVLRTPERRARYDAEHGVPTPGAVEPVRVLVTPRVDFAETVATPWLSGRAIRRLPSIVIGSLLLLAVAGIALVLHIERSQPEGTAWTSALPAAPREAAAVAAAGPGAPGPATPAAAEAVPAPVASAPVSGAPWSPPSPTIAPSSIAASSPTPAPPPTVASSPAASPLGGSGAAPTAAAGPAATATATAASAAAPGDVAASPALEAVMPRPAAAATLPVAAPRAAAAAPAPPAPTPAASATAPAPALAAPQPQAAVGAAASAPDSGATEMPRPSPAALASAAPSAAAPEAARPTPAQKAERTLQAMSEAYRRGDLDALMALFDSGARSELGDRDAIARDYRRLFASSRGRNLTLSNLTWLVDGNRATAFGNYEAVIVPRDGGSAQVVRGSLRVDVLLDADRPRILRLLHDGRAVR